MSDPDVKPASPYPALAAAMDRLPRGSGVYLFKDDGGRVLYVGKAVNLKHRLASYLKSPDRHDPKTALMLKKMARVDVILTATGREALILERNLIKEHRPRYNVMLRDDKNYLCLRLDLKETFPSLRFVRRFHPDGAVYFGPYASGGMARETLKVMKQAFGVRTCKERRLAPRSRPCLEHQLDHCLGPCAGLVTEAAYRQAVQEAILFLKGKGGNLLKRVKAQMEQAAADLDFERAAILRDRIKAITATLERQDMARPVFRDQDVLGLAENEGQALIAVLLVRAGLVTGSREYFFPELPPDGDLLGGVSQAVLHRRAAPAPRTAAARGGPGPPAPGGPVQRREGRQGRPAGGPGGRQGPAPGHGRGQRPGGAAAPPEPPAARGGPPGDLKTRLKLTASPPGWSAWTSPLSRGSNRWGRSRPLPTGPRINPATAASRSRRWRARTITPCSGRW